MVRWQAARSSPARCRGVTPRLSVCCSFEDFDCPFPFRATAGGVRAKRLGIGVGGTTGSQGRRSTCSFERVYSRHGPYRAQQLDKRRLEVVADGLPLHGGAQLTIDTTLVSPLHKDGTTRRGTVDTNGKAWEMARRRKERTNPELAVEGGRTRLVVHGAEGSTETAPFLSALEWAKSEEFQGDARRVWVEHGVRMRSREGSCDVSPRLCSWRV